MFLYFIGGLIVGILIMTIINIRKTIYGIIDVDTKTGMCGVRISSSELANPKYKKVMFKINHDADISREEQSL